MTTQSKSVNVPQSWEAFAWKWMRYSGVILFLLAGVHVLIQDVLVGVYEIDINYVAGRWSGGFWRVYDFLLLFFAFSHGMNGARQVLTDFIHSAGGRRALNWILFIIWAVITIWGTVAIFAFTPPAG
ncbi:MAG: succinate dehydrogenase [Chloroflexi bacterium]|nr:succinate dehydrogenase [Chloroflexota bacterium]